MTVARKSAGFVPISPELVPQTLFARRKFWAHRFGVAPVLPTTRAEMDELGWDSCDVILVTGDAYVDHPSFGMALIGRLLEAHGFRVGIMSQPDWRDVDAFRALGRPTVMWGVTAGNMDSMVNRYTSDRRLRHDDAYSPDGAGGAGRTGRSSRTRSAAAKRSMTCPSSSAASRRACAGSPTTTTGPTRCGGRS